MSDKKNESPEEKEQLAEAVRMKDVRRKINIRCVFKYLVSLFSSEIERNFFHIS